MRVYRYLDKSGAEATLSTRKLWFSDPRKFNDPFEITPQVLPLTEKEALKFYESADGYERHFNLEGMPKGVTREESDAQHASLISEKVTKAITNAPQKAAQNRLKILDVFSKAFRLLCCSHTPGSILMWSHYADKHQGIALEIETNQLSVDLCLDAGIHDVVYRTSAPMLPPPPWSDAQFLALSVELMRTKALVWNYEEEVRILYPIPSDHPSMEPLEFPLNPACIKSIYFGCRAEHPFVDKIKAICCSSDYGHVKFWGGYVHDQDYKLEFQAIN